MKIFKLMAIALVAMLGFTACDNDPEHIYDDHSADLVGTWTCLTENYAEALIINADGTAVSYGVENGEYWENVKGTVTVKENNITMVFEDDDNWTGHFDVIPGMAFSLFEDSGERYVYNYCANDLADEIVGMWVCNDKNNGVESNMAINTYREDGTMNLVGVIPNAEEYMVNITTNYKVVGNLLFTKRADVSATSGVDKYVSARLDYTPNANAFGDILTFNQSIIQGDGEIENTSTYLRIKQSLDLAGQNYDYIKTFVTNVKGLDKDIDFMGYTFNFAKMDGVKLDKMLKTLLFTVEFPDANTIKYSCHYNNQPMSMEAPIAVDGNKMTVKMSEKNPAYKDVDLYTFQDQDNTQMHMYMHSTAFVNFFGNMQVTIMEQLGQLDTTDAAAVKAVFDSIDEAVETINLSLVMTKAAK